MFNDTSTFVSCSVMIILVGRRKRKDIKLHLKGLNHVTEKAEKSIVQLLKIMPDFGGLRSSRRKVMGIHYTAAPQSSKDGMYNCT